MSDKTLGSALGDDWGDTDMFGLDEFGAYAGPNPLIGVAAGAVSNMLGKKLLGGMLSPMLAGIAGGALGAGVAYFASGKSAGLAMVTGGTAVIIEVAKMLGTSLGLGLATIDSKAYPVAASRLNGLGIASLAPGYGVPAERQLRGAGGLGARGKTELMDDSSFGAQAGQVKLMGGPSVSSLAGHYGATLFGTGR